MTDSKADNIILIINMLLLCTVLLASQLSLVDQYT